MRDARLQVVESQRTMNDLLMPSDAKRSSPPVEGASNAPGDSSTDPNAANEPLVEPPSVKLIVRLFLIPLLIVAAAVGVMYLVGLMAGGTPTTEEILARLKNPGGGRTVDVLVGPGSKQRYLDAKALVDTMKKPEGLSTADRIELTNSLTDILANHTGEDEGEVRHFLLFALGRVWQMPAGAEADATREAETSRNKAIATLLQYANAPQVDVRKAAVGAFGFLGRQDASRSAIPALIERLTDTNENFDVRLVAATVLGPIASPSDSEVIEALNTTMRDTDPRNAELVWSSALSLAQLGERDVEETILKLLSREELSKLKVYDRENDPKNPVFRALSEQEQERYLINTMLGATHLGSEAITAQMRVLAEKDRSARVRYAAKEILQGGRAGPGEPK